MSRTSVLSEQDLERELLRKSVVSMGRGRHRCRDCGRSPLVGEHVHHLRGGVAVCELCAALRREPAEWVEPVREAGVGATVRVLRAA
jgi:hypothetical protein